MPFRQLPASDPTRTQALQGALKKWNSTTGAARLISAATGAALETLQPKWEKEVAERADAFGQQSASTLALSAAADKLRLLVSHFIQVYQMGIARGDFAAAGRAVYELSVNEETVPNLDAEAALLLWADRIVKGDPRRVAQFSEAPMTIPAASAVAAALQAYNVKLTAQTDAKDQLEAEQADVIALRSDADKLIRDVWDEVEFALRQLEAPTLRRRAREWGVVYAQRPGEPEEGSGETPEPAPTPPVT
jgi:hypothetical protein